MKDIDILQVVAQIGPFVGAKNAERKTDQGPYMNGVVGGAMMMGQIVNLGMTVMAAGDTIVRAGGDNLLVLKLAVVPPGLGEAGLEESAATATAVVVGLVRRHLDDVFLADHRFNYETEIFGYRVTVTFPNDLAGILDGELDSPFAIPFGTDFQPAFTNPFGIVLINGSDFELVVDVEFFQSGPD